jgi:hypothetical protein
VAEVLAETVPSRIRADSPAPATATTRPVALPEPLPPASEAEDLVAAGPLAAQDPAAAGSLAVPANEDAQPAPESPRSNPLDPAVELPAGERRPLREQTRRFLRPLLGIDPAQVAVYRGPLAGRLADTYQADALSSGAAVVLGPGHSEESPADLGLLAHELTHVARRTAARFVPPLQDPGRVPAPHIALEEGLAEQVQQQVVEQAHAQAPSAAAPSTPAADDDWGGLPAPWQPLPDWMRRRPIEARAPEARGPETAPAAPAAPVPPAAAPVPAAAPPPVQRQEHAAPQPPARSAAAAPEPPPPQSQPEPDLDELARQVYAVLKRRLSLENRRIR